MVPCVCVCLLATAFGIAAPAAAQDKSEARLRETGGLTILGPVEQTAPAVSDEVPTPPRRPSGLVPLYVSFASLQALDAHSTIRALDRGAVEANPLMRGFAGNRAGLFAVKVAGTVGAIYASEKMWKKHKVAAVVFMVAANSAMAWIVQHNYRAVR